MTKVTNKHSGILNIAGVEVRPGATAEVDADKFKSWTNGNAAKIWLKEGLVVADTKVSVKDPRGNDAQSDRQALEGQASALGVDYNEDTSDEDLANAVAAAEQDKGKNEREALLAEARELGLNPNVNTGTAKLQKMIADKKAAQ